MHEIKNLVIVKGILMTENGKRRLFTTYDGCSAEACIVIESQSLQKYAFFVTMSFDKGGGNAFVDVQNYQVLRREDLTSHDNWSAYWERLVFSSSCRTSDEGCPFYHHIHESFTGCFGELKSDLENNDYKWKWHFKGDLKQIKLYEPLCEMITKIQEWYDNSKKSPAIAGQCPP